MKKTNLATGRGGRVVATCFRCLFVIPMLLLGCFGATSAAAQTQQALSRVSLDAPDATVITVFQAIQQQTGCSFVYNTSDIDTDRKVSLSVHDEPLQAVLDKLFAGSDIAYTLRDKHIVLSKKAKNSPPHSAQGGVTGVIKDDKGMPLVGATVLIKGTTTGAAADIDGNFSLPQAKPGDTLEISLIGYTKQELPVSGSAPLSVVMHEDNEVLDAVVVTALGIKRSEKALTYNVQEVAGDIVNTVKDANFMNSLSGKVAGLQINASASGVGGSTRVVMRGVKSISGNNNALYVIDGIPMPDLRSSQTEGTYETPDGGDFEGISNLNPEDIESMTVLSGATAAALYGSQGANGVIVITTKKGEEGRVRTDNMVMNYTRKIYASSDKLFASEYGNYQNNKIHHNNLYADALLSINKSFFDDKFSLSFNLGASILDDKNDGEGFEGHLATLANKFSVYNVDMSHSQTKPYADRYHDQTQAVYATAQLGYNGMVYLDVTARNEWASQLAFTPHMNIFYPSVGLSAVISSMADLSKAGLSFLKVRASYAEVGNAPQRVSTGVNTPLQTGGIVSSDSYAPAVNLTPERTKSFEVGLNAKFLGNKIWTDVTYYNTNTYNQLFSYDAPPSTGYKRAYINAGKVNNWGIEAVVGYKNKWRDFSWSTNVNFSMNRNEVKELVPEGTRDVAGNLVTVDEVNMDYGGYRMKVKKGGSIGDFYVTGLKTDDQGRIYVDPNTNTVTTDPNTWLYGGNTEARFRLGWNNRFSYKGVNLGVLFDARIGGQGVSATQALMDRWGASQDSADARENGGVWISEDQKVPDARVFYANNGNGLSMLSHYVYSMTNVRLRELTLGYDLPSRWFNDKIGMTVSLVGRNLWMLYNKAPFDPEITASTGTYYQGLDYFMQPSARTIGFSVRLQF